MLNLVLFLSTSKAIDFLNTENMEFTKLSCEYLESVDFLKKNLRILFHQKGLDDYNKAKQNTEEYNSYFNNFNTLKTAFQNNFWLNNTVLDLEVKESTLRTLINEETMKSNVDSNSTGNGFLLNCNELGNQFGKHILENQKSNELYKLYLSSQHATIWCISKFFEGLHYFVKSSKKELSIKKSANTTAIENKKHQFVIFVEQKRCEKLVFENYNELVYCISLMKKAMHTLLLHVHNNKAMKFDFQNLYFSLYSFMGLIISMEKITLSVVELSYCGLYTNMDGKIEHTAVLALYEAIENFYVNKVMCTLSVSLIKKIKGNK